MKKTVQEPTIRHDDGPVGGDVYEHPAYGQIGASRVQGANVLYGSDFMHNQYIRIRISPSQVRRDLSNDWHHAGRPHIEVDLSEAQWATFVSAMNVGEGVPCTLAYLNDKAVPGIPEPIDRTAQFGGEVQKRMESGMEKLKELAKAIEDSGLSQKRQGELLQRVRAAQMDLGPNVKFVADQFVEHMDETKERAKTEVNAYVVGAVTRAGLQALGAPSEPLLSMPDRSAA